jgi:hypothetical protein
MDKKPRAITKTLSLNDSGETGGHQAGICVPKGGEVLRFFPDLGNEEKNPRVSLYFVDASGKEWKFNFIYYNNKFFDPKGTRNEYRLTGMTAFFRENSLKAGDDITLIHNEDDTYSIQYKRQDQSKVKVIISGDGKEKRRLVIGSDWKVIEC